MENNYTFCYISIDYFQEANTKRPFRTNIWAWFQKPNNKNHINWLMHWWPNLYLTAAILTNAYV